MSHPVPPLIERGRILMNISFLGSSKREIKNMNKGKVGAPFEYPHSKKTYFIRIFGSCKRLFTAFN